METPAKWTENVILVDADYVDRVTFHLIVNFERMLGRRIPQADMARWIDCIALDGGLRQGNNETQVVFIHGRKKTALDNFTPGQFASELNEKAFRDNLGEFQLAAYPTEDLVSQDDFFLDALRLIASQPEVKRIMVVPDAEHIYNKVASVLRQLHTEDKHITVFAMQPMPGGSFAQEILGYSLMSALGIRSDEIHANEEG
jgi:hypothetical protein